MEKKKLIITFLTTTLIISYAWQIGIHSDVAGLAISLAVGGAIAFLINRFYY